MTARAHSDARAQDQVPSFSLIPSFDENLKRRSGTCLTTETRERSRSTANIKFGEIPPAWLGTPMGAGASSRSRCDPLLFDELPSCTVAELKTCQDGQLVQVVGHVEPLDETLLTPFHETRCVAAEVVGGMARWRPQSIRDLQTWDGVACYRKFTSVLRASRAVNFMLRDPPENYLVEQPDGQCAIVTHEGSTVEVIQPSAADWAREHPHLCSTWLGHKHCERDLRFDPEHGILIGSTWEMDGDANTARLVSPGRRPAHAQAFWDAHTSTYQARVARWNALVNQGGLPCWQRKYKVTERTLRVGDSCSVIGEVRRTEGGDVELHCGASGLLITNNLGAARALPPRSPSASGGSRAN